MCWNVGEVALKAVAAVVVDKPRHRLKRLFVYDGDFAVGIRFNDDPFANVVAGDSDVNNVLLFVDAEPYEVRASNVRAFHQPQGLVARYFARVPVIIMSHHNVQPHVSIDEVAC